MISVFELATANPALRPLFRAGSRAARATLKPIADVASAAVGAGMELERRALERVLDSPELERLTEEAFDSQRAQTAFAKALDSEAAGRFIEIFFESKLFDEIIVRLLESPQLWTLVEEIADSPPVTAAITQQGLGFADQVGDEVRRRSRRTDDLLERAARRLSFRHGSDHPPKDESQTSGGTE